MLFVPTLLAFTGLILAGGVAAFVARGAFIAMSPVTWENRWLNTSFITFAWHEFGRALFLGMIAVAGTMPLTIAFFAGSEKFLSNVSFLTLLAWGGFTAGIFFIGIVTGLVGFLRYEAVNPDRPPIITLVQMLIVAVATVPILVVFLTYLLPNLSLVIGLWFDTMGLYAEIAS